MKIIATVLIAAILCIMLSRQGKDMSLLLSMTVSCVVLSAAVHFFRPVLSFVVGLGEIGNLHGQIIQILVKIAGIGLVSRVAGFMCVDAGNQTLGKVLELVTTIAVLYLSLPILEEMISILEMTMKNL